MLHTLLAGLLGSWPYIIATLHNGGDYSPFSVSPSVSALTFDEAHAYAPPARHFFVTGRVAAEVDTFEHRNLSAGIPFLPTLLLGGLARVLGSLERAFVAADVIFPALLFLLFYALSGKLVSIVSSRLLLAWTSLLIPFGLLNSVWLGDDALLAPLEITRTPQPEISLLVLLLAVAAFGRALAKEGSALWISLAGAASGAIVYCYYFYAVGWGIALLLILLLGLFWKARVLWYGAGATLLCMVLLSVPYALVVWRGKQQGGQGFLLARMGAATHRPSVLALLVALLLTFGLVRLGKILWADRPTCLTLAALATAGFYGMNIQIISGYETQPWHFWKRLALPILFFLSVGAAGYWAEHATKFGSVKLHRFARLLLAIVILNSAARLTYAALQTARFHRASNPDVSMLAWVASHVPEGLVIGTAKPELILLIPVLTVDYTYVPSGLRSLASNEEIVNRYDELACLLGLSPAQISEAARVPNHLGHSFELLHVLGLTYVGDKSVYRSFTDQYAAIRATCPAPRWRLDLVIVSPTSEESAVRLRFPTAHAIYGNTRYRLLDLRRP